MQLIPIFTPLKNFQWAAMPANYDGLFLCPYVNDKAVSSPRERLVRYFHNLVPQLLSPLRSFSDGIRWHRYFLPSKLKFSNMQTLNIPIGGTIAETLQELQAIKDACVTAIFNSLPFQEFLQDDTDLERWQLIYLQSHSQIQKLTN